MSTAVPVLPPAPNRLQGSDDYVTTAATWVEALPPFGVAIDAVGHESALAAYNAEQSEAAAANSESLAAASAAAAAASAASAAASPGTSATSTSNLTVGVGTRLLTVEVNKTLAIGQFVIVANTPTPSNYMLGQITAFVPATGALTLNVVAFSGSGTYAVWSVSLSAPYINPADSFIAMSVLSFIA